MKKDRVGEVYTTTESYKIVIIEYINAHNCTIQFENGYEVNTEFKSVKNGQIRNPYHPSVWGIGYVGVGKYKIVVGKKKSNTYNTWNNLLSRCYFEEYKEKHPTYKDCTADIKWHSFQNFAEWYEVNYVDGFALDKDILIKGNKIYSPETCCFVPKEINSLFIKPERKSKDLPRGVLKHHNKFQASFSRKNKKVYLGLFNTLEEAFQAYKQAKEDYIKELAEKYKDKITEQVYQALINYKVDIND